MTKITRDQFERIYNNVNKKGAKKFNKINKSLLNELKQDSNKFVGDIIYYRKANNLRYAVYKEAIHSLLIKLLVKKNG